MKKGASWTYDTPSRETERSSPSERLHFLYLSEKFRNEKFRLWNIEDPFFRKWILKNMIE